MKKIISILIVLPVFVFAELTGSVDYSSVDNWVNIPSIYDKPVDVFYVCPTVSSNSSGYMDISNPDERDLALGIYKSQASIFFDRANVISPYYRQCSTGGSTYDYIPGQQDVDDAFQYYLTHINPDLDRPFILAGHSQGSRALKVLISNNFTNRVIGEKMIAAYLIGETITLADLTDTGLLPAQGEADTGVIVSFNTQAPGVDPGPMVSTNEAFCINPLNWKTDATYAATNLHKGAMIYDHATGIVLDDYDYPYLAFCDAQIDVAKRGLMATIPAAYTNGLDYGDFGGGVYHRYDYDFWYENLKENVGVRIDSYVVSELYTTNNTPIIWLEQMGYTNDFEQADIADPDHDGFANWEEYHADTNPTNGTDYLMIKMVVTQPAFTSSSNCLYAVKCSSSLKSNSWSTLTNNISGTGGEITITDTNVVPACFYRLSTKRKEQGPFQQD